MNNPKGYAFFDFDGTIYNGFSTNRFIIFLAGKLRNSKWALAKEKDIINSYKAGKLSYKDGTFRITELEAKLLNGYNVSEIRNYSKEFWNSEKKNIYPWVFDLINYLKEKSFIVYLVTASITPNVEVVSGLLNIDKVFSTSLEIKDDKYNGNTLQVLDSETKSKVLNEFIKTIPKSSLKIGFGDSTGDIGMLKLMDRAYVVNLHQEEMKAVARKNKWSIINDGKELPKVLKSENF